MKLSLRYLPWKLGRTARAQSMSRWGQSLQGGSLRWNNSFFSSTRPRTSWISSLPWPHLLLHPLTLTSSTLLFLHLHEAWRLIFQVSTQRVPSLPPGTSLVLFYSCLGHPWPNTQPVPVPTVLLFPLCFVFAHHLTHYICFTHLTHCFPLQNTGCRRAGSSVFCGVFCMQRTWEALSNCLSKRLNNLTEYLALNTFKVIFYLKYTGISE